MSALLNNVKLLDLSTLLHRFVKVVKWISQSCIFAFPKQSKTEDLPRQCGNELLELSKMLCGFV